MTFDPLLLNLAARFLEKAQKANVKICLAESCTGGLICSLLTEIPGSSAVMDRGFVTYTNDAKSELLGVSPAMILNEGAVSKDVAKAMADGALTRSKSSMSVSVTGIAGPGGSENKPVGLVYFGLAKSGIETKTFMKEFGDCGRENVRLQSVAYAIELLSDGLNFTQ